MTATEANPYAQIKSFERGEFERLGRYLDELDADGWVEQSYCTDWLVYQDLDDLIAAVAEGNEKLTRFDASCFSGEYVTGVEPTYLSDLEFARSDVAKTQRRQAL